ncbi:hypothetical protein PInf_003778 [Phytophthora infestans]|nr:hypothetical protein PInf_003778 [Phytophthora infestans]
MTSRVSLRDAMRRSAAAPAAQNFAMARTLRLARQYGSLNLSSRDFHVFPNELDLSYNEIAELPNEVETLKYLVSLKMRHNHLRQLPLTLWSLETLTSLDLSNNELEGCLPEQLGKLDKLRELGLEGNKLTQLPESIGGLLTAVKYIDLRQNKLEIFPTLPENNSCLDQLFLGFNLLRDVPQEVVLSVKESLTVLDVRDNKLQRLSDGIPQLYRLKTLDVTNNDLFDLPPGFGYLKYLTHLLVEGNPLRSIRRSIISAGTEPLKKYLRTRGKPPVGVDAMEEEVDEFAIRQEVIEQDEPMAEEPPLEDEYLFRNAAASGNLQLVDMKLQNLPYQLHAAGKHRFGESLLQLNLSKNWLVELPATAGQLTSLQTLTAEQCGLKSVHASIAMLPPMLASGTRAGISSSLKELDLRNNVLTDIPQNLQNLQAMDTLLLSFNRIKGLNGFPWSSMSQLSVLSIADNRLESCGTVYQVPKLTSLSLENNELRQIPAEFALCETSERSIWVEIRSVAFELTSSTVAPRQC